MIKKENDWLKWLEITFSSNSPYDKSFQYEIGDDAVLIPFKNSKSYVVSNDLLIEKVHFNLDWMSFESLGYKSLAVNLSDLASMGGYPKYIFLSLAIPHWIHFEQMKKFYLGMKPLLEKYRIKIIGGDTSRSPNSLFINIFAFGVSKNPIFRQSPKNHDWIYVTGSLGESSLGLACLQNQPIKNSFMEQDQKKFIFKHFHPIPRINEMIYLKSRYQINSSIDISDGFLGDLKKLLKKSSLGARIQFDILPKSKTMLKYMKQAQNNLIYKDYILSGGEDYEILFTSPDKIDECFFKEKFKTSLKCIGKIQKEERIEITYKGEILLFQDYSYQH